jgi:hypothetical protein
MTVSDPRLDPGPESGPDPVPAPRRRRPTRVIVAALVVILVLGSAAGYAIRTTGQRSSAGSDQTALLAIGGQLAVDFTSFDYRHLNAEFAATAKRATPAFAKTYLSQSKSVASFITKAKAVSTSRVVAAGLCEDKAQCKDATTGTVVLVALDDVTTNASAPKGTTQYFRMEVDLTRQNGRWIANEVQPL